MTGFEYHRRRNVLNVQELSKILGVHHQAIYSWENGRAMPRYNSMLKLTQLYGVTMEELLKQYPEPSEEIKKRLEVQNDGKGSTVVLQYQGNSDDS